MLKNRNISILGCGWLGLALGEYLADEGYSVKGSTTTQSKMRLLVERGIIPFLIHFDPKPQGHDLHRFLQSQTLIELLFLHVQEFREIISTPHN